jgi:uncharacterized protein DUF3108
MIGKSRLSKSKIGQARRLTCVARLVLVAMSAASSAQTKSPTASVSSAPASRIIAPPPGYRLDADKFVYSVQWHLLNAGTTTVALQRSNSGERLVATADSAGMVNKIFRVHDIFQADIDPRTFCTLQISKYSEEGSHRLERRIHFDYPRTKSQVDDKDLKTGNLKHAEFDIPSCVTDVVTGFFYAASLPLDPGFSQIFPVNDGRGTTDVKIEVESRDNVKVAAGTFQTVRVKAEPLSGAMKGKGVLWVWFSDDARRVPVQMKSKLGFATLLFQLQQIETQPNSESKKGAGKILPSD